MPIYEFECNKCSHRFEVLIRNATRDMPKACPKCNKGQPVKVFSAFSVAAASSPQGAACEACPSTGGCPMAGMGCGG